MQTPDSPIQKQIERTQKQTLENRRMAHHRFFLGYAYDLFTHARLYAQWKNLLAYIRRFRMIAFLLRILTVLLTVVETGALVLLTTAVFLVILPIATAWMIGILLTALLESRRTNRALLKLTEGARGYVLFLPRGDHAFFLSNAKALASENCAVFVISPYWISTRGIRKGNFYCTARREAPNLYLVRRYYFFSLRKHVLKQKSVSYLY